jgi:[ribosomal protein S18]-alanine N-acetyltransferase
MEIHAASFPNYWNSESFTNFFSVPGTFAFIAENAATPAAMAVCRVQHEQADLITIAVSPPYRRQGIARLLMRKVMETAVSSGARTLFLDVEEGNQPALALYQGLGFAHLSRRKLYYRQKDGSFTDALVMKCKLA